MGTGVARRRTRIADQLDKLWHEVLAIEIGTDVDIVDRNDFQFIIECRIGKPPAFGVSNSLHFGLHGKPWVEVDNRRFYAVG